MALRRRQPTIITTISNALPKICLLPPPPIIDSLNLHISDWADNSEVEPQLTELQISNAHEPIDTIISLLAKLNALVWDSTNDRFARQKREFCVHYLFRPRKDTLTCVPSNCRYRAQPENLTSRVWRPQFSNGRKYICVNNIQRSSLVL